MIARITGAEESNRLKNEAVEEKPTIFEMNSAAKRTVKIERIRSAVSFRKISVQA